MPTTKGNNTKPRVLSNNSEKKTINFPRSLTLNKKPKNLIHTILSKKNSTTRKNSNMIFHKSIST